MRDLADVARLFRRASGDRVLRTGLERAISSYWRRRAAALSRYPHVLELAERVSKMKRETVSRLEDLLAEAAGSVERSGGRAHLAKTAGEAREIVGRIVGSGKVVVKAKSITSEEVGLREFLEGMGNEVYETDLGEFLVQFLGPKPMHFTSPAIHLTRERVAEFLSGLTGEEVDGDDVAGMVRLVRKFLRERYLSADVGITGANAFAADSGAAFILENESNARLVSSLPRVHVAVVGVEKIVPTTEDAWDVVEVVTRFAGYGATSYVDVVAGPSGGGIGPEEYHVVFLDNGRIEASGDPVLSDALRCLRCGACQYACPVFGVVGGYWAGLESAYSGGIGVAWEYITGDREAASLHSLACLLCARCREVCPVGVDQPAILRELRERLLGRG